MTKLPYLRTMFATCMLFQVIYVLCVVLWLAFPDLNGHALLLAVFPNFKLLTCNLLGKVAPLMEQARKRINDRSRRYVPSRPGFVSGEGPNIG